MYFLILSVFGPLDFRVAGLARSLARPRVSDLYIFSIFLNFEPCTRYFELRNSLLRYCKSVATSAIDEQC